jgi:imidazolonepropionase
LIHAAELLTGSGVRAKDGRHPSESDLGRVEDGAIVYETIGVGQKERVGAVLWTGSTSELPKKFRNSSRTRDLKGRHAVVPGLVDCHTHLVFAGDRSDEFARRCGGATYEQIAASGGGIVSTVRATRGATSAELLRLAVPRVREAYRYGVRTLEIKSGYGLDEDSEIRQLQVVRRLSEIFPDVKFQSTYLGAHAIPTERNRDEYVREMIERTLPKIAKLKCADAVDVFIDEGYFTGAEGRRILLKAASLGFKLKIHADELSNTESAALAAELGALSADHLLKISPKGVEALAKSQTTAVLLPGTAFYLRAPHAPARALIEAGARVALSTDFNPGTCMTLNLPAVMTIGALYLQMSRSELFAAVTYNGARALGFEKSRGTLEPGMDAAYAILPFRRFEEIYYRFAWSA